jgi:hypothetical protein
MTSIGSLRRDEVPSRRARRIASTLLAVYAVLLALVLLSPSNHLQSSLIVDVLMKPLSHVGLAFDDTTFNRLEVLSNAAIIAPVTFLGSMVWPRWPTPSEPRARPTGHASPTSASGLDRLGCRCPFSQVGIG